MALMETIKSAPINVAWTTTEERLLTNMYPAGDWPAIMAAIPRHTQSALVVRASKLHLKKIKPEPPTHLLIKAIVARRHELGMSQTKAAELANFCRTQICRFERGLTNPSLKSLFRMCDVLGVELTIRPKVPHD